MTVIRAIILRPFIVSNDSRAIMVEEICLRHAFVNNVNVDMLMDEYDY